MAGGCSYQDMRLASRSFFKRWLAYGLAKIIFLYIELLLYLEHQVSEHTLVCYQFSFSFLFFSFLFFSFLFLSFNVAQYFGENQNVRAA